MRHRIARRKLGRKSAHRIALLRNLSTSLFKKERITTTLIKAKALRSFAEKLITCAKRETLHSKRQVLRHIHDREAAKKLFDTLSARFSQRNGGYMRILRLGPRRGDGAEMAIVELIGSEPVFEKKKGKKTKGGKKAAKKTEEKEEKGAAKKEKKEKKAKAPKEKKKDEKSGSKSAAGKKRSKSDE